MTLTSVNVAEHRRRLGRLKCFLGACLLQCQQQVSHIHACTSHAPHAHTHIKMYTCTYCDRKIHLANSYYDKLRVIKNNIWIHNANTQRPQKVWVPKGTPNLINVGVSSSKT